MTAAHHLIKEIDTKKTCLYCGDKLKGKKWNSEFETEFHYKTIVCSGCKSTNRVKVDFHGSGHDHWDGNGFKINTKESLEKKIKHKKGINTKGKLEKKIKNL
jgi:hypothetical protein